MFHNLGLGILLYFVLAVMLVVAGAFAAVTVLHLTSLWLLLLLFLPVALLMGMLLTRLAVEPLRSHLNTLERYSAQTLHELNLPTTTIVTNVAMLQKQCMDPKAHRRIERIIAACSMLRDRYDELDYLIKRQMEREVIETFDLETVIAQRLETLQGLYRTHTLQPDLKPVSLKLDRMGFLKVLDNLVDNAVKYSPAGSEVTVTLDPQALRITDRGRGMDQVELLSVFDRYYQADESMPGFGIGLDLVKRYCDRHRIALRITSVPQEGTVVILDFSGVR